MMQNKCIRYCLNLNPMSHIGLKESLKIDWLNTKDRFLQCLCSTSYNYFKGNSPSFMTHFETAHQSNIGTRFSHLKLLQPKRKTNMGQNTLSFLGPQQWNKLPNDLKRQNNLNTFKNKLKIFFWCLKKSRK